MAEWTEARQHAIPVVAKQVAKQVAPVRLAAMEGAMEAARQMKVHARVHAGGMACGGDSGAWPLQGAWCRAGRCRVPGAGLAVAG